MATSASSAGERAGGEGDHKSERREINSRHHIEFGGSIKSPIWCRRTTDQFQTETTSSKTRILIRNIFSSWKRKKKVSFWGEGLSVQTMEPVIGDWQVNLEPITWQTCTEWPQTLAEATAGLYFSLCPLLHFSLQKILLEAPMYPVIKDKLCWEKILASRLAKKKAIFLQSEFAGISIGWCQVQKLEFLDCVCFCLWAFLSCQLCVLLHFYLWLHNYTKNHFCLSTMRLQSIPTFEVNWSHDLCLTSSSDCKCEKVFYITFVIYLNI